ncbi:phosphatidylglycerophosphatase A [Porticoccus sp. W117]|uniref:phosphatidylglycerophosphatase A family protein n=1 Tax=Porticoccus sp. W117 TaxID=3054777 RepID=UPI002598D406|nr:phosphatidylglycerophosphatase A [Porticoccus sp. W117]MDM3872072.1 phosphatidylglycerophosphatase A [Porticoccus sp. W117]
MSEVIKSPTFPQLLKNPVHLLAFGFGSGLSPKAPGTAGTVLAVLFYLPLSQLALPWYLLVVALTALLGIYLCGKTARDLGVHDHPGIVWDEFVGFWLAMAALPATWCWIAAGFVLFRIFDIAKPWPIGWCDKRVHGGTGIMLDDLLAGIYSWIILFAAYQFF